jgi:hypothetical protein
LGCCDLLAHRLNPFFLVGHLKHCANAHTEIAGDCHHTVICDAGADDQGLQSAIHCGCDTEQRSGDGRASLCNQPFSAKTKRACCTGPMPCDGNATERNHNCVEYFEHNRTHNNVSLLALLVESLAG